MDPTVNEWLNLALRWIHIFAGILWIGQTYFFTWLDGRMTAEEKARKGTEPAGVWMVHSGGFYRVEKRSLEALPPRLWWFRWEAAVTWLSGLLLLVLIYYMGGGLLDRDVADISLRAGISISVGALLVGWVVYDWLARTPLARSEAGFAAVALVLVAAVAWGLAHWFSGRAVYIHVGGMFGTIMALNVWERILPAQRRMIAQVRAGEPPEAALAADAKRRSKHNTFMAVPVVFLMISHHYPVASYGHPYAWLVLVLMVVVGWAAAKLIRSA
jgi:uncharacterized membrane protein